ncbi:MAG: hypothetical protein Q8M08_05910 [Bacteroidales bacterium]|nr:hypothetical protein [Bacteroidales bacterium]
MKTACRSILLITQHRQLGAIVAPWEVVNDPEGWFVLQNRLNWLITNGSNQDEPQAIIDITTISQTFTDAEIHRRFSRKGISSKDFFKAIPKETLLLQIRPFIERQMDNILRIAIQHDIPVFEHEDSFRVYHKNRLMIRPEPADPWFCFTKTANGSNYVLELLQQEQKIGLKSPGNKIICRNPCWFKTDNRMLHFPEGFDGKKIEPFLTKEAILIPATAEKKYFETFILKTLKTGQVKASGFKVQTLNPIPLMELSTEFDWQEKAVLVIWFRYGEKRIMAGKSQKVFIDLKMDNTEVVFSKTERDTIWEAEMVGKCLSVGLKLLNDNILYLPGYSPPGNLDMYPVQ